MHGWSQQLVSTDVQSDPPAFARIAFLCGEDMNPSTIRRRWPDGRFIGIGWVPGVLSRGIGLPPNALGPRIWGILVETGAEQAGMYVPVKLRDGSDATAVLTGDASSIGSLPGVLAEARYWELPRDYRDLIEAAIRAS